MIRCVMPMDAEAEERQKCLHAATQVDIEAFDIPRYATLHYSVLPSNTVTVFSCRSSDFHRLHATAIGVQSVVFNH